MDNRYSRNGKIIKRTVLHYPKYTIIRNYQSNKTVSDNKCNKKRIII